MRNNALMVAAMTAAMAGNALPYYTDYGYRGLPAKRTPPKPTESDLQRQAAAEAKRQRKAAKRTQIAARTGEQQ